MGNKARALKFIGESLVALDPGVLEEMDIVSVISNQQSAEEVSKFASLELMPLPFSSAFFLCGFSWAQQAER
jgi:hypothetical protein